MFFLVALGVVLPCGWCAVVLCCLTLFGFLVWVCDFVLELVDPRFFWFAGLRVCLIDFACILDLM